MKVITDIYVFKTSEDIRIYKALWDTGATETLISSKVIADLNLVQTGEVEVSTINGIINTKRFGCGLLLEKHSKSINIKPAEFSHRKECDVIIGMDIIQYGLFILDKTKFSFTIDQLK
jgi:predicted aspartyl protease